MGVKRKQPTPDSSGTHPFSPISSLTNVGHGVRRTSTRGRAQSGQELPPSTLSPQPSPARSSPVEREEGTREYFGYSANHINVVLSPLTQLTEEPSVVSSEDMADDETQYKKELSDALREEDLDSLNCCKLFLSFRRTRRLLSYHENIGDGLDKLASVVLECLRSSNTAVKMFIRKLSGSNHELNEFVRAEKMDTPYYPFLEYFLLLQHPTARTIQNLIRDWRNQLQEAKDFYRSVPISCTQMRERYSNVMETMSKCRNDDYLNLVYKLFIYVRRLDQDVDPFIFICSPSGTGKSSLAYNLANHNCPMIYSVFHNVWSEMTQDTYKPFKMLSMQMMQALRSDVKLVMGELRDPKLVLVEKLMLPENMALNFKTVHFFVELFSQLILIQKSNIGYNQSWMDAQLSIDRLLQGEMTLACGKEKVKLLMKSREGFEMEPLIAFIDECNLNRSTEVGDDAVTTAEMVFLRSCLQLINIIPVLAGTDVGLINFCGKTSAAISRSEPNYPIWSILLNDLHDFDIETLKRLCLDSKFAGNLNVQKIHKFLQAVHTNENPWFIQLVLDHIEELDPEDVSTLTFGALLNKILCNVFADFSHRKNSSSNRSFCIFTYAQIKYALSRRWNDYNLQALGVSDECINRHLGRLRIIPFEDGAPCCFLKLVDVDAGRPRVEDSGDCPSYTLPRDFSLIDGSIPRDIDPNCQPFISKSVFSSFFDAPLTGLILYGVDYSSDRIQDRLVKRPFSTIRNKISTMDAAIMHLWFIETMQTGQFMEDVYTLTTLLSSRANGPSGCSFSTFIRYFIRELSSGRAFGPHTDIGSAFPEELPIVDFGNHLNIFDGKKIPFLSPMSVTELSVSTIDLLKAATEDEECHLGTFMYSTGHEKVDHVVVEFDLDRISAAPPTSDYPKKIFNNFIHDEQFKKNMVKSIPLAAECKQWQKDLPFSEINNIIMDKFKNLHLVKPFDLNLRDICGNPVNDPVMCRTFIIFATFVSEFENLKESSLEALESINKENFYIWRLKNKVREQRAPVQAVPVEGSSSHQPGQTAEESSTRKVATGHLPRQALSMQPLPRISQNFLVSPLDGQTQRRPDSKDVIVISLDEILGHTFTDYLFTQAQLNLHGSTPKNVEYEEQRKQTQANVKQAKAALSDKGKELA